MLEVCFRESEREREEGVVRCHWLKYIYIYIYSEREREMCCKCSKYVRESEREREEGCGHFKVLGVHRERERCAVSA